MSLRSRAVTLAFVTSALSGCCGAMKQGVQAYATAADGVAQSGIALVNECAVATQDPAAETHRQESCKQAVKNFQTIATSAKQLQDVK